PIRIFPMFFVKMFLRIIHLDNRLNKLLCASLGKFIELPPKKNWKLLNLAAKPLRIRGGLLAACGGEMRSD
ncbi:MAG: hypothetical protein COS97_00310, partial [Candidatus Nealsonbacteria bacterium CG07_land_8_20_14_0_80_40_10]